MTSLEKKIPSRGRLFKIFTDLGPYFRKQHSTESLFFFDCLEICVNPEKEPEDREFYGWWLILTKDENGFSYQRTDGLYNLDDQWVEETLTIEDKKQVDQSFDFFINNLQALIESETGLKIKQQKKDLIEA